MFSSWTAPLTLPQRAQKPVSDVRTWTRQPLVSGPAWLNPCQTESLYKGKINEFMEKLNTELNKKLDAAMEETFGALILQDPTVNDQEVVDLG